MLVANFPSLLSAGNQILMNVIYLNDLCSANETVIPRVFKIAKNNFDVINVFCFHHMILWKFIHHYLACLKIWI
ncbi:hypothetical protein SD457_07400 [Coprobacillaceae bacterium CR2/5/TPMF4]|nr:hypothetical protein SD457_07400 [Coprobacillaceae bacterium CR2/5/TPMF4]